ncbi:MAG: T9SS type A sorting domain-containing protein, partial [Bacteroidota bacterium]|nr:T9SS type A sorting domain-containing protein [Bacteroidota bacterium]
VDSLKIGQYTLGVLDISVGIEDQGQILNEPEKPIKLYPNPSSGHVTIDYRLQEEASLKIIDMQGRLLDAALLDSGEGKYIWDATEVPEGTYLVYLQALNNKVIASDKVMVVR